MTEIELRKKQHMDLARSAGSQSGRSALWEDVHLIPVSLPEISINEVDLRTEFLGHALQAPLVIAGMTGGHRESLEINGRLAQAASEFGLAIGTGSQRAALANPELVPTYAVIRQRAPKALVIGNIGMSQLVPQQTDPAFGPEEIRAAVAMVEADLLAIHLNAIEELIQPEGDREMRGIGAAINQSVKWSPVPVIAKETGAGMSRESAARLATFGVQGLDVGGVGGTSFARIEALRAREAGDERGMRVGRTFEDWGIPTALSVIEASVAGLPLIATGGIRNGLEAAKALALGASLVGLGGPAINAALESQEALITEIAHLLEELRVAMTLVGAATISDLRQHRPLLLGQVGEWIKARRDRDSEEKAPGHAPGDS
jgi:isopentenyl-diphosphate delta-isomerase